MVIVAWVVYLACVVGANGLILLVGVVPVGFGLVAPAGTYAAGFALAARDWLQDVAGRRAVVGAILLGACLSAWLSPSLAVASGTAFLCSELADFAVYTPLRARGYVRAVLASNAVGLVVDSGLFLWLAFGTVRYLPGQLLGKTWATLAWVAVIVLFRSRIAPGHAQS